MEAIWAAYVPHTLAGSGETSSHSKLHISYQKSNYGTVIVIHNILAPFTFRSKFSYSKVWFFSASLEESDQNRWATRPFFRKLKLSLEPLAKISDFFVFSCELFSCLDSMDQDCLELWQRDGRQQYHIFFKIFALFF